MFDELREAFREALENFNRELKRDQVPETVNRLLSGMRHEITDEKAAVRGLEEQVARTREHRTRAEEEARTARRRQRLALEIDDAETARLADEYATKHEQHADVLSRKEAALVEELEFRRRTVDEMFARYREAEEKRDALASSAGRSEARESISAADDLFDELDRVADMIDGNEAHAEAAEEMGSFDAGLESPYRIDPDEGQPAARDVDAALAELKRRMGEGGD
jgi:phage shock protein A